MPQPYQFTGLDFETYCEEDIRKVGIYNYTAHPSFQPILVSVSQDEKTQTQSYQLLKAEDRVEFISLMMHLISQNVVFAAHNADFERLCCKYFGLKPLIIDTAVICRANGASSSLANATAQLGVGAKLPEGKDLIKKFCHPAKDGSALVLNPHDWTEEDWKDWPLFVQYCAMDAESARQLASSNLLMSPYLFHELTKYATLTTTMNERGWPVDLNLVDVFQARADENKMNALDEFRHQYDKNGELNLNSHVQLKKWCKERGVLASSFDEQHVASMLARIAKQFRTKGHTLTPDKYSNLFAVHEMLRTKRIIGGSSLKKLPVIKRLVCADGRLRGQYLHVGAGQSYRTSGTGAQMQNLPRLNGEPGDVRLAHVWTNDTLAHNLRQCFTASHPDTGRLLIGDLSSIESRGLAYLAGEQWKLDAYAQHLDLYKVLASNIYSTSYELISKPQRQTGKVGELSCGYGAGAGAVQSFANKMGVEMSETTAAQLVDDWRSQCPKTVALWARLDALLHEALKGVSGGAAIGQAEYQNHLWIMITPSVTPQSLLAINPKAQSIKLMLLVDNYVFLSRVFHGCYYRGRDVCYYKATDRKSGPVWSDTYRNPKTKQITYNKLYGGKLTGILVQSFCRELFFRGMHRVFQAERTGFELIGQFHDELIVDWWPDFYSLHEARSMLKTAMTEEVDFPELPIEAEVQSAYRYIK